MSLFEKTLIGAEVLGVIAFVMVFMLARRRQWEIRSAAAFFFLWAAVYLFEYYFLGENSYIHMDDEGDHFLPYYMYLLNQHLGGQFGHALGGGNDIYSVISPGIQLVSPEMIWLSLFPLWIAILVHKIIVLSVGFWGAYLLCRRSVSADVYVSATAAALFTVSTEYLVYTTYTIGSSLAFLPLAIYVLVVRSHKPDYFRYAVPVIVVTAIYLDPTHVTESMFAGLGLAAIMFKRINLKVAASLGLLFLAQLVNWAEPLYGMAVMSSLTERGGDIYTGGLSAERIVESVRGMFMRASENKVNLIAAGVLIFLWLRRDSFRGPATLSLLGVGAVYLAAVLFPWREIGLAPLSKLSHQYIFLAVTGLLLAPLAQAAMIFSPTGTAKRRRLGPVIVLALAIGMLVNFKAYNFANLLFHGGQNQYHSIDTMAGDSWRPAEPFRVMTLRVRDLGPEPALAYGFYGLESWDVFLMLQPRQRSTYFRKGILKLRNDVTGVDPRLMVDWSRWRDGLYRGIGEQVSLPLLKAANVGFILSPLPMKEDGVRRVAGPKTPPMTRDARRQNLAGYLKDRVARLFDFPELYVYALADPYPQVFSADRLVIVPDAESDGQFLKKLENEVPGQGRVAMVRHSDAAALGTVQASLRVKKYARIQDGFTADVVAPDGGILVVNTIAVPFWRATADGNPLDIQPVNYVQMGVQVPPGTKEVRFTYHRPTVKEALRRFFI